LRSWSSRHIKILAVTTASETPPATTGGALFRDISQQRFSSVGVQVPPGLLS
jgi:hypothetical protein